MPKGWQEIEHTADWSIRVWANTLSELYEQAAVGMLALLDGVVPEQAKATEYLYDLSDPDAETLLVDWLTELIWLIESDEVLLTKVEVNMPDAQTLHAEVIAVAGATYGKHIKAATYHQLEITRTQQGYETTIVFDV